MKPWAVGILAIIGGFAVFKYIRKTPFGQAFTPEQTGRQPQTSVSAMIAGLVPGVPSYAGAPAINRPDQVAAAMTTNSLSTIDGSQGYAPAFGPTENRSGTEVW